MSFIEPIKKGEGGRSCQSPEDERTKMKGRGLQKVNQVSRMEAKAPRAIEQVIEHDAKTGNTHYQIAQPTKEIEVPRHLPNEEGEGADR